MLTIGSLNSNTGCQCCSVRCSSVNERHLGLSKVENFNFRSGSEAQCASKFREDRSNYSGDCHSQVSAIDGAVSQHGWLVPYIHYIAHKWTKVSAELA